VTPISFPENWTPPAELQAHPRETSMMGGAIFIAVMAWILLLAALPLLMLFRVQNRQAIESVEALRSSGREANATIVKLWHAGKSSTPMVSYSFLVNGARFTADWSVPSGIWPGLRSARFLPVRYLPADPNVNHPLAWDESTDAAWVPFTLPMLLGVVGGALLWVLARFRKLTAEGLPAPGVVTKCVSVKGGWLMSYQFRTQEGEVLGGASQFDRKLEVGSPVCVLYLAAQPGRSQIYPTGLFRVKQ
jgi:hypothetical protein